MTDDTTNWAAPGEPTPVPPAAPRATPNPPPPRPPAPPPPAPAPGWWLASDGNWYPPQQQATPTYQVGYGYAARQTTNGMAIASLVLGILWLYWVGSILALIFGYVGKRQIDESRGLQGGRGMAVAGIVLGWIGVGILAAIFLFAFLAALGGSA